MKSTVSVVKVQPQGMDYAVFNSVKESIDLLGGVESLISPGKTVLIKPNISTTAPLDYTNPSVTYAIAKIFSDYGCEVLLGEDPAIPTNEKDAYEIYGMHEIAQASGARVVSLRSGEHITKSVPQGGYFSEIPVSRYAAEADFVVSAATMKSANITTVTLGLKNMKGIISPEWKRKFHTDGLNQGVVDLNRVVKSGLTIIDGTLGRDMPRKLCYPVGVIIAGRDPVATDATCCRIMGFQPEEVEHLNLAYNVGLGKIRSEEIDVLGIDIDSFITELRNCFTFSKPKNPFKIAQESEGRISIVQGNPCSICLNELGNSLALLKDRIKEFDKVTIFVGPNVDPSKHSDCGTKIFIGNCLKKYRDGNLYVAGCPPTEDAWITEKTGSLKELMEGLLE